MANYYVRSGAAGAGTGADWTNAFTTLTLALASKAAGDVFYVAHDHAESTASAITLTSPGTNANPCYFYCVNSAGSVPPVSVDLRTTATVTTTGNSTLTLAGTWGETYGIIFVVGNSTGTANLTIGNANRDSFRATNCSLRLGGTGTSSIIGLAYQIGQANKIEWNNTTVQFGSSSQSIRVACLLHWKQTPSAIVGATLPTTLFTWPPGIGGQALCEGVDLSALGSGKTLVTTNNQPSAGSLVHFKDCKLGSAVTVSATPTGVGDFITLVTRSDSSGTNYRSEKYHYLGTQTVETTIVRTGGASDGTTPISWKIVTTANSRWVFPFEALPIAIWNDTVGSSITVTVYGIWGGGAVPNNDNVWIDCEYMGSSSDPQGSFISASKADNLASGSALTSDSSTWGGSTTKFKMSVTFTPQQRGAIYIYVKAALASSTFYIDPEVAIS